MMKSPRNGIGKRQKAPDAQSVLPDIGWRLKRMRQLENKSTFNWYILDDHTFSSVRRILAPRAMDKRVSYLANVYTMEVNLGFGFGTRNIWIQTICHTILSLM